MLVYDLGHNTEATKLYSTLLFFISLSLNPFFLSLQGVCGDQSKVYGYHRFQQADFSEAVLVELRKLFEARSELLHQKVALHAYTALLSRLQVESYLHCLLHGENTLSHTLYIHIHTGWI